MNFAHLSKSLALVAGISASSLALAQDVTYTTGGCWLGAMGGTGSS